MIFVNEREERDHQLEALHDGEWVEIMVNPHSKRVVRALIAWRDEQDRAYFKKHKVHLYKAYRAKKIT